MENGESTEQAALRETSKKRKPSVLGNLYSMIAPHINRVHIFFLADMQVPFLPVPSLEVAFSRPLKSHGMRSFLTVSETLKRFIDGVPGLTCLISAPIRLYTQAMTTIR